MVSDRSLVWAKHTLRIALGVAFLSAVADRFGWYGPPGSRGVAWGSWEQFVAYTQLLNWFLPAAVTPLVAGAATLLELTLAVALIAGRFVRLAALGSAVLLLMFGVAMAVALDPTAPLDYSVFTAAAGAFLLAEVTRTSERAIRLPNVVVKQG
jgi:putative oxidoreductase